MKLEKTTIMSAIVCISGLLAEVIFQNALSKSIFGIVLSIIIAVMVIIATYFTLDGINAVLSKSKSNAIGEQFMQEQMFNMMRNRLDEQLTLLKNIYEKLDGTPANNDAYALEIKKAIDEINAHTLQSSKIIVQYQMKSSAELKEVINSVSGELSGAKK